MTMIIISIKHLIPMAKVIIIIMASKAFFLIFITAATATTTGEHCMGRRLRRMRAHQC